MRIAISHLTRMRPGYICVAGIDLDTGRHVRPVLAGRLPRSLLLQEGGVFEIGSVVELGTVKHVGKAPETEDYLFHPKSARVIDKLDDDQFWTVISESAKGSLREIFGDDLQPQGKGLALKVNGGTASLGCLRTLIPAVLTVTEFFGKDSARVHLNDGEIEARISVTDLRLYEQDQVTLRDVEIHRIAKLLQKGKDTLFCVGLSRAWQKPGDTERRHWLQLNNIHLKTLFS